MTVPNLLNSTVAENKLLPEARVSDGVNTELQGDVVPPKCFSESLMLELDLGLRHSWISSIIIGKVDNPVAHMLGGPKLPVIVVAEDNVSVVAGCQAAGWWFERGDELLFRNRGCDYAWVETSFRGSPQLFYLKAQQ